MPFGLLSQVCHTTCSSSSFFTAAIESFTPLRSLLPSFRYFTAGPFVGLAGTSVRFSLQCLMAARHQRYSADKFAAQVCFFFAAGAFTGRLNTFAFASKKALLN